MDHFKLLSTILFSLMIFASAVIASVDSISLKSCIKIALSNNNQLIVSKGNTETSIAGYETARSSVLPQISLSGGASKSNNSSIGSSDRYSAGVQAQLEIFDFGKSYSRIAGSERLLRASEADALTVRQSVLVSVCSAYYNCLAAAALKNVSIEALKLSETHLDQAKILLEAGKGVQYNVIVAEVDVENNRLSLLKAQNNVETSRLTLINALGSPLADTLFFSDSLAESLLLPPLESILKIAHENRPEIKSAQLKREAAEKNVAAVSCSRYPDISSSAGAGYQSPISRIDWQHNWNIGVSLSLPLYEGGAISASIRQAKGNLLVAEGNLAIAEQNVSLDVQQQYQSVKVALSSIEAAQKLVEQSSSALAITQERYKIGSGTPLEISNAELVFSNAKIALIQALTDLNSSNANLQRAMGTLSEAFAK